MGLTPSRSNQDGLFQNFAFGGLISSFACFGRQGIGLLIGYSHRSTAQLSDPNYKCQISDQAFNNYIPGSNFLVQRYNTIDQSSMSTFINNIYEQK